MSSVFWVCVGGAVGSGARYLATLHAARTWGDAFPYGTFAVNVLGSFLLGALLQYFMVHDTPGSGARLALTTGAMGGFTTYSTFNYELVAYLRDGAWSLALGYLGATVLVCGMAGITGIALARWAWPG